ncbi:MAG TPA: FAD-dependent oxidoreductase [Thermohalobaculum sp.]|nr:FAD-dependent oxidoreductase [Thermohalobaculum sp.]
MTVRVVVIGGGQAGAALVAKLRNEGFGGAVTLIGDEPVPPYQRPPLSKKYLLGEFTRERLFLKPESFYGEHDIEFLPGTPVTGIDRAARQVAAGGRRVAFDVLALATGALPRRLPAAVGGALAGVHVVRTLADIDRMAPEVTEGRRALIVGGGYIGLEAAAVCALKGLRVTLIEVAPRILQRVAAAETADFIRALHRDHGVEIRESAGLERLDGGARVEAAVLAGGERLDVDLVIVGIGITPDTRLAEAAGLALENGIAVDGRCRTSDPAILAAGDCASFPFRGARVRLESVQNAIDQAEHAARVIMGAEDDYDPVPWFWSDQYDARLQIAGLSLGYDRTVVRPAHRPGGQSVWYYRGARFLAVDAVNDPKAYMQGKRWLEAGVSPDPQALAQPDTELRGLG